MSKVMKGKLKAEDERRIRQNFVYLKEEIDGKHIVDHLYQRNVISLDDKEEIDSQITRSQRTEKLLTILLNAGPGAAYQVFYDALEEQYNHVAKVLKDTPMQDLNEAREEELYDWFDKLPDSFKKSETTDAALSRLATCFGKNWESLMLILGHKQPVIEIEMQNCGHNGRRAITGLLIKWHQRLSSRATYEAFIISLKAVFEVSIDNVGLRKIIMSEYEAYKSTASTDVKAVEQSSSR
ncbi:unnamed protein product [Lymnaea stagnalis]|uniref:CARD domain-containing protein n=1 Tax=Lymnaea stagnalis TaxID=6523 RepID=A0AAV2H025_LYMST